MNSEQLQEQACLYVAGALPKDEAQQFEQALRGNHELRALVAGLRDASETIAEGIPQLPPPPGLKQRIFDQIESPRIIAPEFAPPRVSLVTRWVPLALAASFAILCVILLRDRSGSQERAATLAAKVQALEKNSEQFTDQAQTTRAQALQLGALQQQLQTATERLVVLSTQSVAMQTQLGQNEALRKELDAMNRRAGELGALSEALRSQIAELQSAQRVSLMQIALLKSLLENSPDSVGVSVWDKEHQNGTFVADKLPTLADDKDYQLWILDPKYDKPVSAGVFVVDANGHARYDFTPSLPVEKSDRLAVSIERKGGSPQPEGKIVLLTQ